MNRITCSVCRKEIEVVDNVAVVICEECGNKKQEEYKKLIEGMNKREVNVGIPVDMIIEGLELDEESIEVKIMNNKENKNI